MPGVPKVVYMVHMPRGHMYHVHPLGTRAPTTTCWLCRTADHGVLPQLLRPCLCGVAPTVLVTARRTHPCAPCSFLSAAATAYSATSRRLSNGTGPPGGPVPSTPARTSHASAGDTRTACHLCMHATVLCMPHACVHRASSGEALQGASLARGGGTRAHADACAR